MIVDDHQIVVDGLKALIDGLEGYEVVGYANNGREALDYVDVFKPEIVLMDIDMPGMNGLVTTERLQKSHPDTRIIILSLHLEKAVIKHAISLGASGYVPKNADQEEVIRALDTVQKGGKYFSGEVTIALSESSSGPSATAGTDAEQLASLSEREIEILKGIAEGKSSKEIGEELFISPRTVDTHRTNIMRKLDTNKVAGLIRFAMRNGIVE